MSQISDRKVALVTGATSGIGQAAAIAFAKEGYNVVVNGRDEKRGESVVREITSNGGQAVWLPSDVTDETAVESMVDQIMTTFGRLDCAFNNAGSGGRGGKVADLAVADFNQTIDGYLKSVFLCMKYEITAMVQQGNGAIVNNSSVDGKRAFAADPLYSAAKHGVIGLTKSAAVQYAQKGIRINAVCPGWVNTPALEQILSGSTATQRIINQEPIGRIGQPEEIANAVVWLCSEQASFVVGTAMNVDGGYLS